MDAVMLIERVLSELEGDLKLGLDRLSPEELTWRPDSESNSIAFTFWHLTRAEDHFVNTWAHDRANVFETEGWAEKWGIPIEDHGYGYTLEQLASFPEIPISELWNYYDQVREVSLAYLGALSPADLEQPLPGRPESQEFTVGDMFAHFFCEVGEHIGQVRYLRGLQRGINK